MPMKHFYSTLLFCLALHLVANATQINWTGTQNGNWSNPTNWSINGVSGIRKPAAGDTVIFSSGANISLVHVDQSVSVNAMWVQQNVTLYASTPVIFTISNALSISRQKTLKDSTSENVAFNMVINGATGARAFISGDWVFEGRVPVNRLNAGATFIAEPGSRVFVQTNENTHPGAQIIFKKNTGTIVSDKLSLRFSYTTNYIIDDNLDAIIPSATWVLESKSPTPFYTITFPSSNIYIKTNLGKLTYADTPSLPKLVVDLPALSADASLNLPNLSSIGGNFHIQNTNGHTLTLLSPESSSGTVSVSSGTLIITGSNTKVALATAKPENANTNFYFSPSGFSQTGGNFSLQDFDGATGSSTLSIRDGLFQSGGTFYTNSTSTSARFAVVMSDPFRSLETPESYFTY